MLTDTMHGYEIKSGWGLGTRLGMRCIYIAMYIIQNVGYSPQQKNGDNVDPLIAKK